MSGHGPLCHGSGNCYSIAQQRATVIPPLLCTLSHYCCCSHVCVCVCSVCPNRGSPEPSRCGKQGRRYETLCRAPDTNTNGWICAARFPKRGSSSIPCRFQSSKKDKRAHAHIYTNTHILAQRGGSWYSPCQKHTLSLALQPLEHTTSSRVRRYAGWDGEILVSVTISSRQQRNDSWCESLVLLFSFK